MEYVPGGELRSQISDLSRLPITMARFYAAEVVIALEHLHGLRIAYRDLKPENILIDHAGHVKISDLGFAKRLEDRTYTLCGTPEYLAPEIIKREGHGTEVDIWALGVLIYEMLTGLPPYVDRCPADVFDRILYEDFEFPPCFDNDARDLVEKCLKKDPRKRISIEEVKKHKWFDDLDFDKIENEELQPPWVPSLSSEEDCKYFRHYNEVGNFRSECTWRSEDFEGF